MSTGKTKTNQVIERAARYFQEGKYDHASALCKKILTADPEHTAALSLQGVISASMGDLAGAVRLFRQAVRIEPDNPILNKNLAKALVSSGNAAEGLKYYAKVVSLRPADGEACNDLACAYLNAGDNTAAEICFKQALAANPANASALNNMGTLVREQGRFDEAIGYYRSALTVAPHMAEALAGLGLTLQETGAFGMARDVLENALKLHPADADTHFNLALCHLINGDYEPGWREYEWRLKRASKMKRHFPLPPWVGTSLAGRRILVYAEQGIGDEIMFASCIPDIMAQAQQLVIDCEPRLAPLFTRSFPEAIVHGGHQSENVGWLNNCGQIDTQVPIGSLPLHLRTSTVAFPATSGYLAADPVMQTSWRRRLQDIGAGLKIGISWKGGGTALARRMRSIELHRWKDILKQDGVSFINLQYGDFQQEVRSVHETLGVTLHMFPDLNPLTDLDNFAALISTLDLVISIDNSTVHLAGALGVPTWLLLPAVPDWRWKLDGDKTPWYPSLRLFRQVDGQIWEPVLERVARALKTLAGH